MKHVLLVDARAENLLFLRALLEKQNWTVTEARQGGEALSKARADPPDLVIADFALPVRDGYTLLRRWRSDAELREIPFVAFSARSGDPADQTLAFALGADAFIANPAEPDEIVSCLETILAHAVSGDRVPDDPSGRGADAGLKEANERLIHSLEKKAMDLEKAYGELGAREARLRAILETEPECVKLLAADGSLLEMNAAGLALIEADDFSQVANQCVYPLVAPTHRAQFRRLTEAAFEGESGVLEFEIVGLKGGHRWLETHAAPLRDATGKVTALLGITRDITRRKAVQLELRQSEARLRRIMESGMMGLIFWNTAGEIMEANDRFLRMVGYSREELHAGQASWKAMTPPEYAAIDEAALQAVATAGACAPYEKEYFRKDGSRVPILIGGASLPEEPGRGVAFVIDISKRKAAQAALSESENRFRRFFEHSPLGVAEGEIATAKFVSTNQRFADILGYTRAELQELTFKDFTYAEDLENDLNLFRKLAAGEILTYEIEKRYVRKDGVIIWALLTVTALPDPGGRPMRCLAIFADISRRKQVEEKNRTQFDELKRWHAATLGREDRVLELKREVNELLARLGAPARYASVAAASAKIPNGDLAKTPPSNPS